MTRTKARGFAAMSPERKLEVARMGAASLRAAGKSHSWSPETAREAGRKGGLKAQALRREREQRP